MNAAGPYPALPELHLTGSTPVAAAGDSREYGATVALENAGYPAYTAVL